jgi:hypothetical protein
MFRQSLLELSFLAFSHQPLTISQIQIFARKNFVKAQTFTDVDVRAKNDNSGRDICISLYSTNDYYFLRQKVT